MKETTVNHEIKENQGINEGMALNDGAKLPEGTKELSDTEIAKAEDKLYTELDSTLNKGDGTNQNVQNTGGKTNHLGPSFGMGCVELCRSTQTKVGGFGG